MSAGTREEYFGGGGGGHLSSGGMTDFPVTGGGGPAPVDLRYGGAGGQGQQGYMQQGADPNAQQQLQRYRFSPEEMKAIRDCNRESFYYRCLPIGTVLSCGTYYAVRYGYLKPSLRFGPGPKMFLASIVGYFIGKLSYQSVCAEKLMALPNSQLGEILRKKKGQMGFQETLSMEPGFATAAPIPAPAFPNSEFSQGSHGRYSDVGDTQPITGFDSEGHSGFTGLDYNQSTYDTTKQMLDDENLPAKRPQTLTTYDDLRRQNRIDYESRQYNRNHPAPPPQQSPSPAGDAQGYYDSRRIAPSQPAFDGSARGKNKYGDVWDDKPGSY